MKQMKLWCWHEYSVILTQSQISVSPLPSNSLSLFRKICHLSHVEVPAGPLSSSCSSSLTWGCWWAFRGQGVTHAWESQHRRFRIFSLGHIYFLVKKRVTDPRIPGMDFFEDRYPESNQTKETSTHSERKEMTAWSMVTYFFQFLSRNSSTDQPIKWPHLTAGEQKERGGGSSCSLLPQPLK